MVQIQEEKKMARKKQEQETRQEKAPLERIMQKILDTGRTVQEVFSGFEKPYWSESYLRGAQQFLESVHENFRNLSDDDKRVFLNHLVKRTDFPLKIYPFYTPEGKKSLIPIGYIPNMRHHLTYSGGNWYGPLRSLTSPRMVLRDEYTNLIELGVRGSDISQVIRLLDFLPMMGKFVSEEDLRKKLDKHNKKFEIISQGCLPLIPAEYVSHVTSEGCYGFGREVDELRELRKEHPKVEINAHSGSKEVVKDYCFADFFRVDFDSLFGVQGLNEFTYRLPRRKEK